MPTISAILTSAGESKRMGTLKPLIKWPDSNLGRDVSLIEYQISQLTDAGIDEIIVVLGHQADKISSYVKGNKVSYVINSEYRKGKSGSIKRGLEFVDDNSAAILLMAIDQPRPSSIISKVIKSHSFKQTNITSPTYRGRGGHPIIFSADLKTELMLITENKQGIRDVISRNHKFVKRIEIDTDEIRLDLNTPEEYNKAYRNAWKKINSKRIINDKY